MEKFTGRDLEVGDRVEVFGPSVSFPVVDIEGSDILLEIGKQYAIAQFDNVKVHYKLAPGGAFYVAVWIAPRGKSA